MSPVTLRGIHECVRGQKDVVKSVLDELVSEGHVERTLGSRNSQLHRLITDSVTVLGDRSPFPPLRVGNTGTVGSTVPRSGREQSGTVEEVLDLDTLADDDPAF